MKAFHTLLILLAGFLVVFLQAATTALPRLLGAQVDLLPSLMVYAALTAGPGTLAALALGGGLWFDSLSANPLGISVLPLALIGWLVSRRRELLLRHQWFAQLVLGLAASAAAPLLTVLLLLSAGQEPLLGWGSLWQWLVMTVMGGAATPLWFLGFEWLTRTFGYAEVARPGFRPDREIRRGRW
jgi:rod shape-determining protein MreD